MYGYLRLRKPFALKSYERYYFQFDEEASSLSYSISPTSKPVGSISLCNAVACPVEDGKDTKFRLITKKKEYVLKADCPLLCSEWVNFISSTQSTCTRPYRCNSSVIFHPDVTVKTFECEPKESSVTNTLGVVNPAQLNLLAFMIQRSRGYSEGYDLTPDLKHALALFQDSDDSDSKVEISSEISYSAPVTTAPLKDCGHVRTKRSKSSISNIPASVLSIGGDHHQTSLDSPINVSPPSVVGAPVRNWQPQGAEVEEF